MQQCSKSDMSRIQNKKTAVRHTIISPEQEKRRIDNYLLSILKGVPRTRIYQMLRRGEIRVNGGRIKQSYRLHSGDKVRIPPVTVMDAAQLAEPHNYLLERVRNSIILENEDFFVLNKPSGIVVHSGSGRSFGVIEILRHLRPAEQGLQLVHRLDQETSGCLMIAKTVQGLKNLHNAFKAGDIEKYYTALLKGHLHASPIEVEQPLRKNTLRSGERLVEINEQGKYALSRFQVVREFQSASLVKVQLETGRTHQIRVHAKYLQHPVAGDNKYGDKDFNKLIRRAGLKRLFLHASRLVLPASHGLQALEIKAPFPADLTGFLENYT